jgi:aminoglycoside phosphotransferase family enzyme/predicted kinase
MERKYLDALLDPAAYDETTSSVRLVQTHVSFLFITDNHVYKIKKPVDFGFLNFTTLDRRRFYCEEEVRLNRRLCPDMYLGVVELRESTGGVSFRGQGSVLEYAVKMKRLPAERMLDRLLEEGGVSGEEMRSIARTIADFHLRAERSGEIDAYGSVEVVLRNWEENFRQTADFVSETLEDRDLELIRDWVERFVGDHLALFERRVAEGFVRDCDGDMHGENICLTDRVYIFDCIEFNPRFRYSDTAADIAFLLMDVEYRGRRDLAEILLDEYLRVTGDTGMKGVLDFYLVYRAFVRGKVESFRLRDAQISGQEKDVARERAARHFRLARGYILRRRLNPGLTLFSGLMGAGKSTLARELSFQLGLDLVSSDVLRKEMAGLSSTARRRDGYNQGLYSAESTSATYDEMYRRAEEALKAGRGIIIDASFSRRSERLRFASLARAGGAPFTLFHAVCPEGVVKRRLESRTDDPFEPSDGRWELLSFQRRDFEPLAPPDDAWVEMDTSVPVGESIDRILRVLEVI